MSSGSSHHRSHSSLHQKLLASERRRNRPASGTPSRSKLPKPKHKKRKKKWNVGSDSDGDSDDGDSDPDWGWVFIVNHLRTVSLLMNAQRNGGTLEPVVEYSALGSLVATSQPTYKTLSMQQGTTLGLICTRTPAVGNRPHLVFKPRTDVTWNHP